MNKEIDPLTKYEFTNVTKDGYDFKSYSHLKYLITEEVIKQYKIAFNNNPDFLIFQDLIIMEGIALLETL
ncbi:hypothetical protein OBG91_13990 [Lactococcus lactis]|nr:hypothetical protein [Lactococcus lactis]